MFLSVLYVFRKMAVADICVHVFYTNPFDVAFRKALKQHSAANNNGKRQATIRFFVAMPTTEEERASLVTEADYYGDIVLVNATEGYRNIISQVKAMYTQFGGACNNYVRRNFSLKARV